MLKLFFLKEDDFRLRFCLTRDAGPKTTHSHGVFSASPRKAHAGPTS